MEHEKGFNEFVQQYLPKPCPDCGKPMSAEEAYYMERCDSCERSNWQELRAWKAGASNPELDARFGDSKKSLH